MPAQVPGPPLHGGSDRDGPLVNSSGLPFCRISAVTGEHERGAVPTPMWQVGFLTVSINHIPVLHDEQGGDKEAWLHNRLPEPGGPQASGGLRGSEPLRCNDLRVPC